MERKRSMRKNRIRKWLSVLLSGMMAISALTPVAASAQTPATTPTKTTLSVTGQPLHLQGIAVDTENSNMYWSFTETLVKTDLNGNKTVSYTHLDVYKRQVMVLSSPKTA